jgi:hypothetical protein
VGVSLSGVPEVDVPAEEGDAAEVGDAAVVLVCRGLGAALRWDLEGERMGELRVPRPTEQKGCRRRQRTFSPDLTPGWECWRGTAPDAGQP